MTALDPENLAIHLCMTLRLTQRSHSSRRTPSQQGGRRPTDTLGRTLDKDLDYRFIVHYEKGRATLLAELCDKYGSDKGQVSTTGHPYKFAAHTDTDFYSRLFDHCRFSVQRVFECGLGTNNPDFPESMLSNGQPGTSLRAWRDFFPNSEIFGADIDRGVLFDEDRIRTYYVDQLDPDAIASMWSSIGVGDFDLIVDDGLHTFQGGRCLFEHSFEKVRVASMVSKTLRCRYTPIPAVFY